METTTYTCMSELGTGASFIGETIHGLEVRNAHHSHSFPDGGQSAPPDIPPLNNFNFSLEVLDIYTLETSVAVPCSNQELPIQALMKSGYLGNTLATPSLAISLKTLELFRRIRLRKSLFSIEAFAKVICDMYSVSPYSSGAHQHQLTWTTPRCHIAATTIPHLLMCLKYMSQSYDPLRNS